MAVHLSIRRIRTVSLAVSLAVFLAALAGLPEVAGAAHFKIHPGPEVAPGPQVKTVPAKGGTGIALMLRAAVSIRPEKAPETARIAPRTPVEPGSRPESMARPKNMAPTPVRAPRRADAGTTARGARTPFERGAKIKPGKDASIFINARNIPENDRLLQAYSAGEAAKSIGRAVPGLLDIAAEIYRAQAAAGTADKAYSLGNAMRDAVWRKETAAKLDTFMTARDTCPEVAEDSGASKPSIRLGNTC